MHVCAPHSAPTCLHMFSCVYLVCFCTFRSYANNIKGSCTAGITKTLRGEEGGGVSPSARLAESSNKTECWLGLHVFALDKVSEGMRPLKETVEVLASG